MKVISLLIAAAAAALSTGAAWSETHSPASPYAGEEKRAVKALSPQDAVDLRAGHGMGLAKVAELNHYPGPKHVLDMAKQLALTEAQTQRIKQVHAAMEQEAQRLGKQILAKESELENLFTTRRVDSARARALTMEIGQLQGEFRFAHVNAHLDTARVLSAAQIASYDALRGYAGTVAPAEHRH